MMEERVDRIPRHREVATAGIPEGFPAVPADMTVGAEVAPADPARSDGAHDRVPGVRSVSGGRGATISVRYAEALFTGPKGNDKGHRDEIAGKDIRWLRRPVPPGRRTPSRLPAVVVAHVPLHRTDHRDGGRAADPARHPLGLHGLSVHADRPVHGRPRRPRPDAVGRLAHGAAVRARDLHGLPVLRAAPVRRRHAHPGPGVVLHVRRRPAREAGHSRPRRISHAGRPDLQPRAVAPAAVHPAVLVVVDHDGPRLLALPGRRALRARACCPACAPC